MVTGLTLAGNSAFKAAGQPPYPVKDSSKMTAMQIRYTSIIYPSLYKGRALMFFLNSKCIGQVTSKFWLA
jgi:hypothetical protein